MPPANRNTNLREFLATPLKLKPTIAAEMKHLPKCALRHPPLLGLLLAAAVLAVVLVLAAQGLRVAEAPEAVGDGRVLAHVHRQVEEVLVLAAHLRAQRTPPLLGKSIHPKIDTKNKTLSPCFARKGC